MKAQAYDRIKTLVDIPADFGKSLIPKGTIGTIIECYERPKEGYAVDLTILSETGESGFEYENVILYPDQFSVVNDTPEMGNFISVFGDISYEVPQVGNEQSHSPETPVEKPTQE
ncbi:conserved hypothetical protein [Planktothrix sp. PCC 11201]|uniref:DUF4926 domain-containing protein n=1 Tax=Planktothrix sp. PCC 11201 TaxID=1729650 RepID=UPI00091C3BC6|nr:DUF4926 domain-containing protein [Planktothrix sp. PCC 11201]SKB15467.1 conserved hypothetical protein [Planktothrix sp. PCC 11201]